MEFETATVTLGLFEQAASVGVSETVSVLSDLLNSQPITARQAAEKAAIEGIDLRYGTIAAYWSGGHGRPTRETLAKLAKVLPLTEVQLQRAAWNTAAPLGPWTPPEVSALLDQPQRRALDQLIKSIVRNKEAPHADQPSAAVDPSSSSGAPDAAEGQEGDRSSDQGEAGAVAGIESTVTRIATELHIEDGDQRGKQPS